MGAFHDLYRRAGAIILLLVLLVPGTVVSADSPYTGYIYDNMGNSPVSINGYLYRDSIDGYDMPIGPLKGPEDLFVASDDTIYLVDGGNNRVIRMDGEKRVLGVFGDKEGKGKLNAPKGVFVNRDGVVYVADTQNRRIAVFAPSGAFVKEFGAPSSPLLGKNFTYSPSKLIVDKRDYMFVVSDGANQGMLQMKPDGSFAGFFGANHVPFSWTRVIVKLIATKEQKDQMMNAKPPEFSNLYQDSEGFIYTSTLGIRQNQLKRLSAVGVDTLNNAALNRYGDLYMPSKNFQEQFEAFVDLSVNADGLITGLDQTTGKLFQYDKLGNLLFIFGGIGNQDGLFKTPTSVAETSEGTVYVADRTRNRVDRFSTTPFGDKVHEASRLYVEGQYDDAMKPWQDVLKINSNYDMAYNAIGKALYKQRKYFEAMKYFNTARDRASYSDAYLQYRKEYVRNHFGPFAAIVLTVIVLLLFGPRWVRSLFAKRKTSRKTALEKGGVSG
jgi:DNA-binding beta-propeller fold protein YncE